MPSDLSNFVLALAERPETVTSGDVTEILARVQRLLRRELARRGLWLQPTAYLGIAGAADWASASAGTGPGALDELTEDCFTYIFVTRLQSLAAQLLVKKNIDGLVALNVRHFVHERQRQHDPVGFRVFQAVTAAVANAANRGLVAALEPAGSAISARTLVQPGSGPRAERLTRGDLEAPLTTWIDDLVPDLIDGGPRGWRAALERLEVRITDLVECRRAASVQDLVGVVARGVRARWGAVARVQLRDSGLTDAEVLEHPIGALAAAEQEEWIRGLEARILTDIRSLPVDSRTRDYLARLWRYLTAYATDPDTARLASKRDLERRLSIPRKRIAGLLETLRALTREAISEAGDGVRPS